MNLFVSREDMHEWTEAIDTAFLSSMLALTKEPVLSPNN